jgi:hypothetical protein
MAAKKMGRPPKPKGQAKAEVLTMRLTSAERSAAERAAEAAGVPISEWGRAALLAAIQAKLLSK